MRKHLWMRAVCAAALTLTFAVPAFAGQWNASAYGWWYDNGDGTYASPGWHWIDGNNDGTAECYYFNEYGYCVPWAATPDGYWLDGNGAWVVNGVVQTQAAQTSSQSQQNQNTAQTQSVQNQAESEEEAILGTYRGTFTDSHGKTAVDLSIFEEDGDLKAEFIFYNIEGQTNAKDGSYLCDVVKKSDGSYDIISDRWLNQPSGYSMRSWNVTINGKRLEGNAKASSKYTIRCTKRNK